MRICILQLRLQILFFALPTHTENFPYMEESSLIFSQARVVADQRMRIHAVFALYNIASYVSLQSSVTSLLQHEVGQSLRNTRTGECTSKSFTTPACEEQTLSFCYLIFPLERPRTLFKNKRRYVRQRKTRHLWSGRHRNALRKSQGLWAKGSSRSAKGRSILPC